MRALNYAVTPRIDLTYMRNQPVLRQVLQLVTTSYRTGSVIRATANSVTINNGGLYRSTDYYKNMTIEIVSGKGAGQSRTVTASTASFTPTLTVSPDWDVVPDSTSMYRITGPTVMVPGWDPANDANGDGYVDDNEFANRPNPNASARFRWEARATTGGGWASSNATCRSNLWDARLRAALREHYLSSFQPKNVLGYSNDDAFVLLGFSDFPAIHGGRLWEYGDGQVPVGSSSEMNISYRDAFLATHQSIREGGMQWIGTNISQGNLFLEAFTRGYLGVFNLLEGEQAMMDCQSLGSYAGLLRGWKFPAYAAAGVRSVIIFLTAYGNYISVLGNTREAWERLTENKLAMYYLIQVPDYVFFHNWNRTFNYGSYNTVVSTSTRGYWKAGVPQNMAYLPVKMLKVDIGQPTGRIPGDYQPVEYILGTNDVPGYSFYHKVGNTTQSTLPVPTYDGTTIDVPIVPTFTFYLWRTAGSSYGIPNDAVVAREYTKGLVLCRMPGISPPGGTASYIADAITVQLPGGPYRRVNYDGTLGPPVTEVQIRGFEGIILVKAAETSNPNIQISLSVDKTNPKPLDMVKFTLLVENTGTGATQAFEVKVPLPNMTYERGSAQGNGLATATTNSEGNLLLTISSLAPGTSTTITFRAVVR